MHFLAASKRLKHQSKAGSRPPAWPGIVAMLSLALPQAIGGDILRGGAPSNRSRVPDNSVLTSAATQQARANSRDALARTTSAIQSVQAMQSAARRLSQQSGGRLGTVPNHPSIVLPQVPNGLGANGLAISAPPTGATAPTQVVNGSTTNVNIKQTAQQAFINWDSFNVGSHTVLTFDQSKGGQNASKWIAFNEVNDPSGLPSQILGQIRAQGQVYVINQNGIIFGGTSQVNVHTLVASSLPINTNLTSQGLLNNPDNQFLFSALTVPSGNKGTPAFNPPAPPGGQIGDVVVEPGASIVVPTTAAKVGGRVVLVGPNVTNEGTISTPDGQTILAAGLQVGFTAHAGSDPTIRGLDVYVGEVSDAGVKTVSSLTGIASNEGLISMPRGNLTMSGATVDQMGVVTSSTSVSLNGSVRLDASYDAVSNIPGNIVTSDPYLFKSTGIVELGAGSAIQILPENSSDTVVGTQLALPTQIAIRGKAVHMGAKSIILAPNAKVNVDAGTWNFLADPSNPFSSFAHTAGQVYLDTGASINVAGTVDAAGSAAENIITLQFRGSEFADSALNRNGPLRGVDITVDVRQQGIYNGMAWVGTPLADASGFVGIIQRTAQELTTAGGTVNIAAGGSVVLQHGAGIDVSGGWVNYSGANVQTTRVLYHGNILNIANALPNVVYSGIFTGTFTQSISAAKWGITETYTSPFMQGIHYEPGYVYGMTGGTISIAAPSMALDGILTGNTVSGPRQHQLPVQPSSLNLSFMGEQLFTDGRTPIPYNPNAPQVFLLDGVSQRPVDAFTLDASGNPAALSASRQGAVYLSPDALRTGGFGFLRVNDPDGNVVLPSNESLQVSALGSVELDGANVDVAGRITAPGGSIVLKAYDISPTVAGNLAHLAIDSPLHVTPPPNPNRGIVTLGPDAVLDAAGLMVDDSLQGPSPLSLPVALNGGSVSVSAYTANLTAGSVIDVNGGASISSSFRATYGNAGSISIKAGQDIEIASVLGGRLTLNSALLGFAGQGSTGGSIAVQAPFIQIGGSSRNVDTLVLQPGFFDEGGFASFTMTGIGSRTDVNHTPGVLITPGTTIDPTPANQLVTYSPGSDNGLAHTDIVYPEGLRGTVSLAFNAPTLSETYAVGVTPLLVRGSVIMGAGATVDAGPQGNIALKGGTVSIFGTAEAPGGTIAVAGASSYPSDSALGNPLPTVYLGPQARLSTAGEVVLVPDAYDRRIGNVLAGGTISVGGNLVLERGALLDASGTSGTLDIAPAYLGMNADFETVTSLTVPFSSGLTTPQFAYATAATRIDSNGGLISLAGGELLASRATLRSVAGGRTATGGTLLISSGRLYVPGQLRLPSDSNLTVSQSGSSLPASFFGPGQTAVGQSMGSLNGGYFSANDFLNGGFDNLQLGGNVTFTGAVSLNARGSLSVASGGFLYADSQVNLAASYVALGTAFQTPYQVGQVVQPFTFTGSTYNFAPTAGSGSLRITAELIDIGNLTFGGIGSARLVANGGGIRGDGTFSMAGALSLQATQIFPATGTVFTIAAYDPSQGTDGSVTISRAGTTGLPLSAGGTLNIYASDIIQGGVLRAPFGVINLGWDGTGTAPQNLVVGTKAPLPVTQTITLRPGSVVSVSAIDPLTGQGVEIPFGRFNAQDGTWIGPNGQNVTVSGLPQQAINIDGRSIDSQRGSVIDIRGGGDMYAYTWSPGLQGTRDLVGTASGAWDSLRQYSTGDLVTFAGQTWSARQGSTGQAPANGFFWTPVPQAFAVIPGYSEFVSPFASFNTAASSLLGDPGYVATGLKAGDEVQLGGGSGLTAGVYTLLPARYALLPGAFLVTPQTGTPVGSFLKPDSASFVNGYRFNGLDSSRVLQPLLSRWEVAPGSVLRDRADYTDYFANTFIPEYAVEHNISVQRLPSDSGHLVLSAVTDLSFSGTVQARTIDAAGRGGAVDITSASDIIIGSASSLQIPGILVLDSAQLSAIGADSLLIGGTRTLGAGTSTVTVNTGNISVSNDGSPLTGSEIILVSNGSLSLDPTAVIHETGHLSGPADTLQLTGAGALLRLSADAGAQTLRSGVTAPSANVGLTVEAGATLSGAGITLDSTGLRDYIRDGSFITGSSVAIHSGIVRLLLSGSGPTDDGLVLGANLLSELQNVHSLSLLSYSTMDTYGTGTVGSATLENLSLHAAAFRRESGSGIAAFQAQNLLIDNQAGITVSPSSLKVSLDGSLLFNADRITLGQGQVQIAGFTDTGFTASAGLLLGGNGGLTTPGSITATTPFVMATHAASTQTITAGTTLTFAGGGTVPSRSEAALGSSLTLSGTSVTMGSDIVLPSGLVNLTATTGALKVTGNIDVAGTRQALYDAVGYTSGGSVQLTAGGGDVTIDNGATVNVSAMTGGGNAGSVSISAIAGDLVLNGSLLGTAGTGGSGGSFSLDAKALPKLSNIVSVINSSTSGFTNALSFRVRTGDVEVDGTTTARSLQLSADQGAIDVTGTVDVSGTTGGSISISAFKGLDISGSAVLNASATHYDAAGKGGSIFLETRGGAGGMLNIESGSNIELGVTATPVLGDFSGTLHLRAPQNASATGMQMSAINGTITGASSIIAEGFKVFDLTGSGGLIDAGVQGQVFANGTTFGNNAATIQSGLLTNNAGLASVFSVRTGAELINTNGDLTLGASSGTVTNWDLSTYRFGTGTNKAPGILTLRASGDIVLYGALSDGFQSAAYNALLLDASATLPLNAQSWSYRITAGADLNAANSMAVLAPNALAAGKGSLMIGRFVTADSPGGQGQSASTSTALSGNYQVIRTGSGDIDIAAGLDVRLLNTFATIYTAGTLAPDQKLGGTFDTPTPSLTGSNTLLGNPQQSTAYAAQYTLGGGNITIDAQGNIGHFKLDVSKIELTLIPDSSLQMPTNWLYRRGYVDPLGTFGVTSAGTDVASTTWWVDFSNFFQSVGALGGGNVAIKAGGNVTSMDAVIPTNARMPKGVPDASSMVELGGGNLTVQAGGDINAGVYYVERGTGDLQAGGSIHSDSTRQIIPASTNSSSWMPTTLFVGDASFAVEARGDVLLGPVSNPFLLPGGINNSVWYKSYFSTYGASSGLDATSLGGNITFRQAVTVQGGTASTPILEAWYQNVLQYSTNLAVASSVQPWLRLNETDVTTFASVASIGPASLSLTAFAGSINLAGTYNLFPSATGNLTIEAAGSINALQSLGTSKVAGLSAPQTIWTASEFNLSDANPALIPGAASPVAYLNFTSGNQARTTASLNFLGSLAAPFEETGSLISPIATQQALHDGTILHQGDTNPVRIYAGSGDISGLTLFSAKAARVVSGQDMSDVALYVQNTSSADITVVSAARDLLAYDPNSPLRSLTTLANNVIATGQPAGLAGDIQISGPGTLEVLAGHDLRLGSGTNAADGTAAGILSIGNARNPALAFDGASIIAAAGIGSSYGLDNSRLDFSSFIKTFINGADGARYLSDLAASGGPDVPSVAAFNALSAEQQKQVALQAFFVVLRDAGRDHNLAGSPTFGNYAAGLGAIAALFPGSYQGNIETNSRDIRTKSGGDISLLIPGGNLTLQTDQTGASLTPPGVVTESGGNINIFTDQGVNIGISRIFTLRGGNQVIWASTGDIAAGSSSKTVQSAPPTRVIIDPTSANVATDLAGLATGGGIGVLATVVGVPPGSVDLVAVTGAVNAGDAGIRATGNLNIAAVRVLNANNITVSGSTSGTPAAPSVSVPSLGTTAPSSSATNTATQVPTQSTASRESAMPLDAAPSIITVEVIGYGGGDGDDDDARKRKGQSGTLAP